MGFFSKKQSNFYRELNSEEQERRSLGNSIKNDFYPHTNEFDYFLNLGFPITRTQSEVDEYYNWKPKTVTNFAISEIREFLYAVKDKRISIDEITQRVYGFKTFGEFVEHTQTELKNSAAAASESILTMLKTEPPSVDWLKFIDAGPIDTHFKRWLQDLGDRKSTHSAVGSPFRVKTSELHPYVRAALIGFRTVYFVLQKNNVKFDVLTTSESGLALVNDCVFFRGTAINPLDVLSDSVLEFVSSLIDNLDEQMKSMLGDTPTNDNISLTAAPVPFRVSLLAAANGGAMMACVVADPSNCRFYEGWKFDSQLQDPTKRKWNPSSV